MAEFLTNRETGNAFPLRPQITLESYFSVARQDEARAAAIAATGVDPADVKRYQEKQASKAQKYLALAGKAMKESKAASDLADSIGGALNGTPILVDHYSANKVRRAYDKVHDLTGKSFELRDKAEHYEKKAENAVNPNAISSDDPEAVVKLKKEIEALEKQRHYFKNEYVVKPGVPMFKEGSAHYRKIYLESIGRNIRDKQKRIEQLQQVKAMPAADKTIGPVRISVNKTDNRVQIFFPDKPSDSVRYELKRNGFKWAPSVGAWQRQLNEAAVYWAEDIVTKHYGPAAAPG